MKKKRQKGKILGLDYGAKRIGVAITDADRTICFPRTVWVGLTTEGAIEKMKDLVGKEAVSEVVVGWPLNLKGESTRQTQATSTFIEALKKDLTVPVVPIDERFTSVLATQRGGDDAVAAQILLEGYLALRSVFVVKSNHESS